MLKFLYRMIEDPRIYDFVQRLLGGGMVFTAVTEAIHCQLSGFSYKNVLEVGCGTGLTKDCFAGDYTGVDINPEYIRVVSGRGSGTFLVADATSLPFGPDTYDLVVTVGVLHHLDHQSRELMLSEMFRVCRTGGHILIADGLVPSNRLNLIGYVLAKLDRGRYKMRIEKFRDMIRRAYPEPLSVIFNKYRVAYLEFVVAVVAKPGGEC